MKNKKIYKHNIKQIIIVTLLFINSFFLMSVFGRYVVNNIKDSFSRTKEFYFYSDKLGENNPTYQIENWSGVDDYTITINMNSNKNSLLSASYDIEYDISYIASDNIICELSKTEGIIYAGKNSDFFNLTITPNTKLQTGDTVYVEIIASTQFPYKAILKGGFSLIVGQEQLTYTIDDSVNSPYLEVNITNTLSYYTVQEAFELYSVGDKITREQYLELSEENKEKCYSARVNLSFSPNYVLLDTTSNAYTNAITTTTTQVNSKTYIKSITFNVDAISSKSVRFYKVDETQNYSYPGVTIEPIVQVEII